MRLNDLVKIIIENENKKLATDKDLEQTVMLCCESIEAKKSLFRLEKFINDLCDFERSRVS